MRKLLVVLAVLLAVGLFAGAKYNFGPRGAGNWSAASPVTFEGTITVYVYQWMDVSFTWLDEIVVTDYGNQFNNTPVATLSILSNASVTYDITYSISVPNDYQWDDSWNNNNKPILQLVGPSGILLESEPKILPVQNARFTSTLPASVIRKNQMQELVLKVVSWNVPTDFPAGTYRVTFSLKLSPNVQF